MRINGVWIGWGLDDWSHNVDGSDNDPTVRKAKKYMRAMFASYAGTLEDTNKFDQHMYDVVCLMQDKLVARPMNATKLTVGSFVRGALDLPTQLAMGFKKPVPNLLRPIIFTVEGHMSNMFIGPSAGCAEILQNQGVCWWKPVFYDCLSLPFKNKSGVEALVDMLLRNEIEGPPVDINNPDGPKVMWPFPSGTSWGIDGFSQGAMVVSEFMEQEVLNPNGRCHFRLKDFKRGKGIGNPRREFRKMAPWNDNPPDIDTQGIMGDMNGKGTFITTGTEIADKWAENANDGDMFGVNKRDAAGMDKTAVAKIVTENSWIGGDAAIFARVMNIFGNVTAGAFNAIKATVSAIIFLAKNPNPHYATVAEPGDIEWMRGVAS